TCFGTRKPCLRHAAAWLAHSKGSMFLLFAIETRRKAMLLENKNAIIYGASGSIGSGVARTFAREGATVFLVGRTREKLDVVAKDITAGGGPAEVAVVDALDEQTVEAHARAVAAQAGSIDVSFNLISRGDVQGTPLLDMRV